MTTDQTTAIVNTAPDTLAMQNVPKPAPPPGWVRIRTVACGICATDLEMIHGWERTGFPPSRTRMVRAGG